MQQNMHFQGVRFFRLLQFEQLSVLRPRTHLNPNVVRIIESTQNNGRSLRLHGNIASDCQYRVVKRVVTVVILYRIPVSLFFKFLNINQTMKFYGSSITIKQHNNQKLVAGIILIDKKCVTIT